MIRENEQILGMEFRTSGGALQLRVKSEGGV